MNDSFSDQSEHNDPAVTEQAFAWFVRLRSADVSKAERAEFERWINRDERHRRAYEQAQQLWHDPRLAAALGKTRPAYSAARKPRVVALGPAACFALLLVCLAGVLLDPAIRWQADYRTGTGERQTIVLADGSHLILAADSARHTLAGHRFPEVTEAKAPPIRRLSFLSPRSGKDNSTPPRLAKRP